MRSWPSAMIAPMFVLAVVAPARAGEPSADECFDASEAGQRQRERSEYRSARRSFAVCASASCPAVVSRDCVEWFEAVQRDQPTIVISARDARGADILGVRVTIDGIGAEDARGRPEAVDPGARSVRVEGAGYETSTVSLVVLAGEKNRVVVVPMRRVATTAAKAAPGSTRPLWLPVGLGGLSVTALGLSAVLGFGARSDLADARRDPCAAARSCDPAEGRSIERRLLAADVLLGVSVLALGAGVYFLLRGSPGASDAR